uniref:Uncharacterized protein n=1 Tax=Tetranychus urticae TaxID=32264 RepID=T1L5G7_TETUR
MDVVIRTFPSEANVYHENTEYTKKMTSELENSCGSSKSSFDKTDVVILTLIEKDIDNFTSNIIKSIKVDPLSVDFYPHKLTMEQFEEHVQYYIPRENSKYCRSICDNLTRDIQVDPVDYSYLHRLCTKSSCPSILEDIDYPKMFTEMEKFVRSMKYLLLIGYSSPTCSFKCGFLNVIYPPWTAPEPTPAEMLNIKSPNLTDFLAWTGQPRQLLRRRLPLAT